MSKEEPIKKKQKIDYSIKHGLHLNKVLGIPENRQTDCFNMKDIISKICPKKSYFFTFCIDDDFIEQIFVNHPDGLKDVTIIIGVPKGNLEEVRKFESTNGRFKKEYVPMDDYCSHHTKLTILFDQSDQPHVIIGTANMYDEEWDYCTQAFYYTSSSVKRNKDNEDNFLSDLILYLRVGYGNQKFYDATIRPLKDELLLWSFEHVEERIIFSVPGSFSGNQKNQYSLLKIKHLLENRKGKFEDIKSLVGQCSSIGTLGTKPMPWLQKQFLYCMTNDAVKGIVNMKLIYPSLNNIKDSVIGYDGAKFFPYTKKTNDKQIKYLRNMLHLWKSNNLERTRYVPHIKTFTTYDSKDKPVYQFVGSQNLSKFAWGEITNGGNSIRLKSYEMGVLIFNQPSMLIPYDIPLTKYSDNDEIWIYDCNHLEIDSKGEIYIIEPL